MEACNNDMPERTSSNIQYVDLISNQKEHKKKKINVQFFHWSALKEEKLTAILWEQIWLPLSKPGDLSHTCLHAPQWIFNKPCLDKMFSSLFLSQISLIMCRAVQIVHRIDCVSNNTLLSWCKKCKITKLRMRNNLHVPYYLRFESESWSLDSWTDGYWVLISSMSSCSPSTSSYWKVNSIYCTVSFDVFAVVSSVSWSSGICQVCSILNNATYKS